MALKKGIWDPEPRVTNIKGTKLNSLISTMWDSGFRSGFKPKVTLGRV